MNKEDLDKFWNRTKPKGMKDTEWYAELQEEGFCPTTVYTGNMFKKHKVNRDESEM